MVLNVWNKYSIPVLGGGILAYTWVGTWVIFCVLFSKWQFQKTNQGSEFGTEKDCFAPD